MTELPVVTGRNLQRQKKTFPTDFQGTLNLVFIAFLRRHQEVIDEWVPYVERLARENAQLCYYEFPTLSERGPLYRTFLNEGMRAGIPNDAARARTITLYLDKPAFRRALGIPDESQTWLYLFDRSGNVLWRTAGRYSKEKGEALSEAIRQLE